MVSLLWQTREGCFITRVSFRNSYCKSVSQLIHFLSRTDNIKWTRLDWLSVNEWEVARTADTGDQLEVKGQIMAGAGREVRGQLLIDVMRGRGSWRQAANIADCLSPTTTMYWQMVQELTDQACTSSNIIFAGLTLIGIKNINTVPIYL